MQMRIEIGNLLGRVEWTPRDALFSDFLGSQRTRRPGRDLSVGRNSNTAWSDGKSLHVDDSTGTQIASFEYTF
jgi:hypothetical protein